MTKEIYSKIEDIIVTLKRPLVIGINGAYTSGKTVFANNLKQYLQDSGLKTQMIHYDDFHHPFSTIEWSDDTEIDAFYNRAFNSDKLVQEIFAPFKKQGYINKDVACVDLGSGQYTNIKHFDIDDNTIVLLEGVLLFRSPLVQYLDYKIYLDITDDEILRRGRLRDVPKFGEAIMDKFLSRYIPVQHIYISECNPIEISDIVIDNNDYHSPKIVD